MAHPFQSILVHVGNTLPSNYNPNTMVKISTVTTNNSNIHPYPLYATSISSQRHISLWAVRPSLNTTSTSLGSTSFITNLRILYGDERSILSTPNSAGSTYRVVDTDLSGGFASIPSFLEIETTVGTDLLFNDDKIFETNGELRTNPLAPPVSSPYSTASLSSKKVSPITDIILIEVPLGVDPDNDTAIPLPSSRYKLIPRTLSTQGSIHYRLAVQYYDHVDNTVMIAPSSVPVDWRDHVRVRSYIDVRGKDGVWRLGKITKMDTKNTEISGITIVKSSVSGAKRFNGEMKNTTSTSTLPSSPSASLSSTDTASNPTNASPASLTTVRVHYVGWDSVYDEELPLLSVRIAPGGYFTKGEPVLQARSTSQEFSLDLDDLSEIQTTLEQILQNQLSKEEERTFCTTILFDAVHIFLGSIYEKSISNRDTISTLKTTLSAEKLRDKVHEINKLIFQLMIRYFADITSPVPPEMITFFANYFLLNDNCNYFYNHYGHITKDAPEAKDYSGVIAQFPPTGVVACKYFVGMVNCFYSHGGFEAIMTRLAKQTERALQSSIPTNSSVSVSSPSSSSNASAAPLVTSNTNANVAWDYPSVVREIDIFSRSLAMGRWCYTLVWGEDRHFLFRDTIFNRLCSLTETQVIALPTAMLTEILRCVEDVAFQQLTRRNANDAQKKTILYGPNTTYTGTLEENSLFFQKFNVRFACRCIEMGIKSKDIYHSITLQNNGIQILTDRAQSIVANVNASPFTTTTTPTISRTEFLECLHQTHVVDFLLGGEASKDTATVSSSSSATVVNDLRSIATLMETSYLPSIDVLNKLAAPNSLLTFFAGNGRPKYDTSSAVWTTVSSDEMDYFRPHHMDMLCALHGRLFLETVQETINPSSSSSTGTTNTNASSDDSATSSSSSNIGGTASNIKRVLREERKNRLSALSLMFIALAPYLPFTSFDRFYQYLSSIPTTLYDAELIQMVGSVTQQNMKRYLAMDKDTLAKISKTCLSYPWLTDQEKMFGRKSNGGSTSNTNPTPTDDIYRLNINEKSTPGCSPSSSTSGSTDDTTESIFYHYTGYRLLWNLALGLNHWSIRKDPLVDSFMHHIVQSETNASSSTVATEAVWQTLPTVPLRYRQRPSSAMIDLAQQTLKSSVPAFMNSAKPTVPMVQKQIIGNFLEDCRIGLEQNTISVEALRSVSSIMIAGKPSEL